MIPNTAPDRGQHDGDRDGWMGGLCDKLGRILAGQHAQAWLDGAYGPIPRGEVALAVLPTWYWVPPAINVGRKAKPRSGDGSLLMPVRLNWVDGAVVRVYPVDGTEPTAAWVASGLGHTGTGRVAIGFADIVPVADPLTALPAEVVATVMTRTALMARLRQIAADGRAARWEAISEMEPRIRWALDHAHVAVSIEVDGHDATSAPALLDETTISALADDMLLGERDNGPGFAERLIDLCIDKPAVFVAVDPLKYVVTRTKSEAETVIRRKLGDPHVGRKVRALHRETGESNFERLLDLYRERYPSDALAAPRAAAALSVAGSPMAANNSLGTGPDSLGENGLFAQTRLRSEAGLFTSYEDALIERIDIENSRAIGA